MLYKQIEEYLSELNISSIPEERKKVLQSLINYIQSKHNKGEDINLNFICTHNSRRSHLSQVWAQTMAYHFNLKNVFCYSGGTESTAMFPKVADTLEKAGFKITKIADGTNPVYAIKFAENAPPVIGFSKIYNDAFNPVSDFAAVLVCDEASEQCPFVTGAETRILLSYKDPKVYDNTPEQDARYAERSLQIASEMGYLFSNIKSV